MTNRENRLVTEDNFTACLQSGYWIREEGRSYFMELTSRGVWGFIRESVEKYKSTQMMLWEKLKDSTNVQAQYVSREALAKTWACSTVLNAMGGDWSLLYISANVSKDDSVLGTLDSQKNPSASVQKLGYLIAMARMETIRAMDELQAQVPRPQDSPNIMRMLVEFMAKVTAYSVILKAMSGNAVELKIENGR